MGFGDQTASHLSGLHSGSCEGSRTVFFLTVAHHNLGHDNYFVMPGHWVIEGLALTAVRLSLLSQPDED